MTFNTILETKVIHSGLTVDEFCKAAGISKTMYYKYLAQDSYPDPITLYHIAITLSIDPLYLAKFIYPKPDGRRIRKQRHKTGPKFKEHTDYKRTALGKVLKIKYVNAVKKIIEKNLQNQQV